MAELVSHVYDSRRVVACWTHTVCCKWVDCKRLTPLLRIVLDVLYKFESLQCFDAVGFVAGRASSL